jgi:hypothetical protein
MRYPVLLRALWLACSVVLASPLEAADEERAMERLIEEQVVRYPRMEIQDLYKLLHQAAMGSGHAVTDTAAARRWMEREIAGLPPGPPEPLVDPLSPDGRLARVHLRPYLGAGHDPERLLEAFVRTANGFSGSIPQLERYWKTATRMAASGALPFSVNRMRQFFEEQDDKGHPAVHHTATYREAYAPAYRVVGLEYLPLLAKP